MAKSAVETGPPNDTLQNDFSLNQESYFDDCKGENLTQFIRKELGDQAFSCGLDFLTDAFPHLQTQGMERKIKVFKSASKIYDSKKKRWKDIPASPGLEQDLYGPLIAILHISKPWDKYYAAQICTAHIIAVDLLYRSVQLQQGLLMQLPLLCICRLTWAHPSMFTHYPARLTLQFRSPYSPYLGRTPYPTHSRPTIQ